MYSVITTCSRTITISFNSISLTYDGVYKYVVYFAHTGCLVTSGIGITQFTLSIFQTFKAHFPAFMFTLTGMGVLLCGFSDV